jgi:MoaA/NifB/PqqE/SkfB family radical SAM enzyme
VSLSVLYRGPLSSCNYGCAYCPFAKHHETDAEHAVDAAALERFLGWAEGWGSSLRIFFTPWGEALVQPRYQQAIVRLTRMAHVEKVAIQTNLSARLDWLDGADIKKLGIWATYHPEWVKRPRFLERTAELRRRAVSFSVGVVGFPQYTAELAAMRAALPPDVYVWVNAVKDLASQYTPDTLDAFRSVDPHFDFNLRAHDSLGKACAGGHTVISVDGQGDARSCHFLRGVLGNLYAPDFAQVLKPRACTASKCGCHIGYVHLEHLKLGAVFGEGILERVPLPDRVAPGI